MAIALNDIASGVQPELLQKSLSEREQTQLDILKEEFQNEMHVLQARIEKLETSVENLAGKVDRNLLAEAKGHYPTVRPIGLIQVWESAGISDNLSDKNFRVRRADLGLTGEVAKNFAYRMTLNPAGSNTVLKDLFLDYTGIPGHVIRVGQMKTGLSYDSAVRGNNRTPFYDVSQLGLIADEREQGAAIFGSLKKFADYQFGVYNGVGANTRDDNNMLSYGGRVTLRPLTGLMNDKKYGTLELGASFLEGRTGQNGQYTPRDRRGFEARYLHRKFELGAEYLSFSNPDRTNGYGWYMEGIYKFNPKWQMVGRYDFLDPNKEYSQHNNRIQYVAGVNYLLSQYNMRLMLDFVRYTDQAQASKGNTIRMMAQYMF
jgi:hypothetical protein